jgi:hypothetical protein
MSSSSTKASKGGFSMSNVPACPKFVRLAPTPYTFSGNLLLRPVDGCGVDLLSIGNGDLQLARCAALQA